jgi:hypothetical protein
MPAGRSLSGQQGRAAIPVRRPFGATVAAHNSRTLILSSLRYRHALHGWLRRVPNRLYLTDRLILHVAVR